MANTVWGVRTHNGMVFLWRDRGGGVRDMISYRHVKGSLFPHVVYHEDDPDLQPGWGGHARLDDALAVMQRWMDKF